MIKEATELFESAMAWLRENYASLRFFVERDIVWTVQTHITKLIEEQSLPYRVFNEYPILPGKRRSLCTDLAILNCHDPVEVAVEFKYEPSHKRSGIDIWPTKFPIVFWGDDGVGKDVKRIQEFVAKGKASVAYSVFIDEGGHFCHRVPHPGSEWINWGAGVWVLRSRVEANSLE